MKINRNKNYYFALISSSISFFSGSFIGFSTVLPFFLSTLTNSKMLIGLASAILPTGFHLPQLFMAHRIEPLPFKKPVYVLLVGIRILILTILSFIIFLFAKNQPLLVIIWFLFLYTIFSLCIGMGDVPYLDIIGKIVSKKRRSSFFGIRSFAAGILTINGGIAIKIILDKYSYPSNYSLLFAISTFLTLIAVSVFLLIKEPVARSREMIMPFNKFFKKGLDILKKDKNYCFLIITRFLIGCACTAMPFYAIYAFKILDLNRSILGIFISMQTAGSIVSSIIWSYIGDKYGSRYILRFTALLGIFSPLIALALPFFHGFSIYLVYLIFILVGFVNNGATIGHNAFLLNIPI